MSTTIRLKRATTQNRLGYTPPMGEPLFDRSKLKLYLGDGETIGGIPITAEVDIYKTMYNQRWVDSDTEINTMDMIAVDTTPSPIRLLLPEFPHVGDEIRLIDAMDNFDTNEVILDGHGNKIAGSFDDYLLTVISGYILFYAADNSWWITTDTGYKWYISGVGGPWNPIYVDMSNHGSFWANSFDLYIVNTTDATEADVFLVNLPSNPRLGDKVKVVDAVGTFDQKYCVVSSNKLIDGSSADDLLNIKGMSSIYTYGCYLNGTKGWIVSTGSTIIVGSGSSNEATISGQYVNPIGPFYLAQVGDIIMVNTTMGGKSIQLPDNAVIGDKIDIIDSHSSFSTNPCIVLRNNNLIDGLNVDLILNKNNTYTNFIYTESDNWVSNKDINAAAEVMLLHNGEICKPNTSNMVDTQTDPHVIYLPSAPLVGQWVQIFDATSTFGTNSCEIDGNGNNIDSGTERLILGEDDKNVKLTYSNPTVGWIIDYGASSNPAGDFSPIIHDNTNHTINYISKESVTAENLIATDSCGYTHNQVAFGDHTHPKGACTQDEIESALTGIITTHSHGLTGQGAFIGSDGETEIPHGLDVEPSFCQVVPLSNPQGELGEVWVRMNSVNIYVGNTGTWTGSFMYQITK